MFEIKNLYKNYGSLSIYENFNLSINDGEIACILGESGSGKTTLLNCIARLTDFKGEIPQIKSSYVFQSPRLMPNLTVRKNLALICKDDVKITEVLERVQLEDKQFCYPAELSGGQAQRAAIARALLHGGEIFLLDEPFSTLDIKLKLEIEDLFFDIWRTYNKTVLFVTHDVDEAVRLSDRIIIIKRGKIIFDKIPAIKPLRSFGDGEALRQELLEVLTR